ncbi:hypothetical protein GCM10011352_22810 [Marinobacterium zhoushanense]|uniref:Isochorismatase-like domain-containing protein n=1 Tax=Marinobacterium zhoushanense TaxID=1679163 RepID=A0ABQ1KJ60_9GAMM|nr:isochorismatase family protein [Marinobacterium zhoushanense]GGB96145.1 hypothetical protein GCM10011352_22810 [Marinobacterium zhoushanense]
MKAALLVIDIQNDYFPGGAFELENAESALRGAVEAIRQAKQEDWLVIGIQHLSPAGAAFFAPDTEGAKVHPEIDAALDRAPLVIKHQADSFFETDLEQMLREAGVTDLYLTGMMTQHCITHTALSPQAGGINMHIIAKGCAAPTQGLSDLALRGLSTRCTVV